MPAPHSPLSTESDVSLELHPFVAAIREWKREGGWAGGSEHHGDDPLGRGFDSESVAASSDRTKRSNYLILYRIYSYIKKPL